MIAYLEKGPGLDLAIMAAGHWAIPVGGIWRTSNDAEVQVIIDAYPASATAAPIITEIKLHARDRILARYPDWKQANMTARSVELTEKLATGGVLTEAEQTELAAMKAVWTWIKSIRAASDAHEATLSALVAQGDFAGILSYDWSTGWPE